MTEAYSRISKSSARLYCPKLGAKVHYILSNRLYFATGTLKFLFRVPIKKRYYELLALSTFNVYLERAMENTILICEYIKSQLQFCCFVMSNQFLHHCQLGSCNMKLIMKKKCATKSYFKIHNQQTFII